MNVLVTGGAGFIGRWVVQRLLAEGHDVMAVDDLSNGRAENVKDFVDNEHFLGLTQADVTDSGRVREIFAMREWDIVFHLAASIHVQKSIDDPGTTFRNDVVGTFNVLEAARSVFFRLNGLDGSASFDYASAVPKITKRTPRVVCMSTCMVYELAGSDPIGEAHPLRPASPYAASKIAADMLALSYHNAYSMPVTVVRPFNTYGPFQKTNGEGGVVAIFLRRALSGDPLLVKGTGEQTRDLLFVEDCAEFVVAAASSRQAEGRVLNAGTGRDVTMRDLAALCKGKSLVEHVPHDHPQAEIARLCCDASAARATLGWAPRTPLADGLEKTRQWLAENRWAW